MTPDINWSYWRSKQTVATWEAAALAMGMNPKSIKHEPYGWMAGPGTPVIQSGSFSSSDEKSRFDELWDLAKDMADMNHRLSLPEFALLLVSNDWPGIAEPLRMMAKGAAPAWPVPNTAPAEKMEMVKVAPAVDAKESQEQRQERRYKMCIDAGLKIADNDYASLPRGIGDLAKRESITRQSFSEDVKAHIRRLKGR